LEKAVEELPEMVGEFEKPKFFQYDPAICVHGRSGLTACTRCLEACPTVAIVSLGERITVDSQLCQGAGSCATVCPSGAIRYAYPSLADALERLRVSLKTYRSQGGDRAMLLLHDGQLGRLLVARFADRLPHYCIPVEVEEVGSTGMDIWLSSLAYGAAEVVLLAMPGMPYAVMNALQEQLGFARDLLQGMGYEAEALRLHRHEDEESTLAALTGPGSAMSLDGTAEYAGLNDKRAMIRFAVDHLHTQSPNPRPLTILPARAPFGEVWLAAERCTLCMACVSQCPTGALVSGSETPELKFIEQNCVQCGLCARSCPEDAIGPAPRYLHDAQQRRALRLLKAEEAFCCIRCGKPFATKAVITRMTSKLRHHRMFQGEAIKRIQMCEDCRVKDMFLQE
jgi:ferredoxin